MSTVLAVVIALAIAVVGGAVGYLLRTATATRHHTPPTGAALEQRPQARPAVPPPARSTAPAPTPGNGNDRLVHALIGVYDTTGEESVRGYVADQLAALRIVPVTPEPGSPFTPDVQRCVATESDPSAPAGTLIRTDRPGWQGPAGLLRLPDVTVVAAEGN